MVALAQDIQEAPVGYDGKYGKVTTEYGDIPGDEPVIVFRARDMIVPAMLRFYLEMCEANGSPRRHLDLIRATQRRIDQWQLDHRSQVRQPDSERSRAWMGDEVT
jgi:hypothetical protein